MNEFENQTPDVNNPQPEQPIAPPPPVYQQQPIPPQYQPPMQPAQPKDKKGMAIGSLILGIVSIVFGCIPFVPSIIGIILGALSTKSSGKTMAIIGIVLSGIGILVSIFWIFVWVGGAAALSEIGSNPEFYLN